MDTFFCLTIYLFLTIYIPINDIVCIITFTIVCCIPTNYCCLPITFLCMIYTSIISLLITILWIYLFPVTVCSLICRMQFLLFYLIIVIMIIAPNLVCIIEFFIPFFTILICTFNLRYAMLAPLYCCLITFSSWIWGA
jgi:hypothetical protein